MNQTIVTEAKSWIGTPFKMHGRVKSMGCDCIGLILGVSRNLSLKAKNGLPLHFYDHHNYKIRDDQNQLQNTLDVLLLESDVSVGALALMKFDSNPQHIGIIAHHPNNEFSIIHSDIKAGKVVEHALTADLYSKIEKTYKFCE